jgi:hypothetical protein
METKKRPLTREPGMAVALGRVLVLTRPNFIGLTYYYLHVKDSLTIMYTLFMPLS